MIKLGLIHSVDYSNALVRVETGKIITDWLPFTTFRTGTTKTWSPPTVGEPYFPNAVEFNGRTGGKTYNRWIAGEVVDFILVKFLRLAFPALVDMPSVGLYFDAEVL